MEKITEVLISKLQTEIQAICNDHTLFEEVNFEKRAEAIDILEFHIIDTIEGVFQKESQKGELNLLKMQADELMEKLENIDKKLFLKLNEKLRKSNDKRLFFGEIIIIKV